MLGRWLLPTIVAALAALLVAWLGASATIVGPWFHHLILPRWSPPDAVFGVAWTIIFALTAAAGVTAWRATTVQSERDWLIGLFALNGFLNILWSLLFFQFHHPDWALIEVLLLWASVLALVVLGWQRSIAAAILMLPYLGWVTFAGYLNMAVVKLNGPFS